MSKGYFFFGAAGLILCVGIAAFTEAEKHYGVEPVPANELGMWHTLGDGEIIGPPFTNGGWLVLNKSVQDVDVIASFRCSSPCDTGVLLWWKKPGTG